MKPVKVIPKVKDSISITLVPVNKDKKNTLERKDDKKPT